MTQNITGFKPTFVSDDPITAMIVNGQNILVSAGRYIYQLPLSFFDVSQVDPQLIPDKSDGGAQVVIVTPEKLAQAVADPDPIETPILTTVDPATEAVKVEMTP